MYRVAFTIICILITTAILSQEKPAEISISFLDDSTKEGMPVQLVLTAKHNRYSDFLLPDSLYDFRPFEYIEKEFYPTVTRGSTSYDSVIYYLRTFELDSVQKIRFKAFEVNNGDSTTIFSNWDSLNMEYVVTQVPDSINNIYLIETTNYYRLPKAINYPYIIAFILTFAIITVIVWLIFGTKIKSYFAVRRLNKQHRMYQKNFEALLSQLNHGNRFEKTEELLVLWKKYMEKLENIPYSKLTTREIRKLKNDEIDKILIKLDRVIYAKRDNGETPEKPFEELKSYSNNAYSNKLNKLKHGISG